MKRMILLGLLALAACDLKPAGKQDQLMMQAATLRDALNRHLEDQAVSTCINGVVFYITTESQNTISITPAFAEHGKGTIDCRGGVKIPIQQNYGPTQ